MDSDWLMRWVPGVALVAILVLGGGARKEYAVAELRVERDGWDTLEVHYGFAQTTALGGRRPLTPRAVEVSLFSRSLDTLYVGSGERAYIPDAELGDAEPIPVEVCGDVGAGKPICEQRGLSASPKRVRVEQDITYPDDDDMDRGRYTFRFVVERQQPDGEAWEPIKRTRDVEGYLLARVGATEESAVRVPFRGTQGRFNLKRYAGYEDFAFYLKSSLMDAQEAAVHFDLYATLGTVPVRLASVEKTVRSKSRDERRDEVYDYVEQAAAQILAHLDAEPADPGAMAWIDEWQFSRLTNEYVVKMEVEWRSGGFFGRQRYRLHGVLQVGERGTGPVFRFTSGNDRAERRWQSKMERTMLRLDTLAPYEPEENPLLPDTEAPDRPDEDDRTAQRW